jgi:transcriptional regulator with GAF, ATPase, and Fis domain
MARPSRTGGKTSKAKARDATPAKGRKTTKTKPRVAPAATRVKRRSISDPSKDLKEAREQQAATAEILKAIASSPSNVSPIFDAIAERSNKLVSGLSTAVLHLDKDMLNLAAFTRRDDVADAALTRLFPCPVSDIKWYERTIRAAVPVRIEDCEVEFQGEPALLDISRKRGFRSVFLVPLLRDSVSIGLISVTRAEVGNVSDDHIRLLQTFADQAVIAIENARLFADVQAKTRDLEESLQQQTATADVLRAISRSAFDLDTVLDTLISTAVHLCDSGPSQIFRRHGDVYRYAASRMNLDPGYHQHEQTVEIRAGRGTL